MNSVLHWIVGFIYILILAFFVCLILAFFAIFIIILALLNPAATVECGKEAISMVTEVK